MKDGYYLSTYLHIDEIAHLERLRIRHDQNLSLWHKRDREVNLVRFWELERITGLKKHNRSIFNIHQAHEIIDKLLSQYGLRLDDMVEVWGTPQLQTDDGYHSLREYPDLSYHSIAHIFSTVFFDSDLFYNEKIVGLAVDGGPDSVVDIEIGKKNYYSGCFVNKGSIDIFPVYSPGFLWTFARKIYNLREGSLMALASASESQLNGSYHSDIVKIKDINGLKDAYWFVKELTDRVEDLSERDEGKLFNYFDTRFSTKENKISMVMKEIQRISIKIIEQNIDEIIDRYSIDTYEAHLALSGGYALNCPTNSYLMEKYKFKGFIAPPCVSDSGMSLGIALYAFYKRLRKFDFKLKHAFYGENDDLDEQDLFSKYGRHIRSISHFEMNRVIEDIKDEPIVWFEGNAEIGPRALGHRSIIADPRKEESKERLNIIKERQWWRPVAPIILEEDVYEWFENSYPSPFMLNTFTIKKEKKRLVPAIVHLDDTARIQTITKDDQNSLLCDVLHSFKQDTGIPLLCNTSLNDKGEPIINTVPEAINFALRKKMRIMYVNGKRIELWNHIDYEKEAPLERKISMNICKSEEDKLLLLEKYNPFKVPRDVLIFYYLRPELRCRFDINKDSDIKKLLLYASIAFQKLGLAAVPGV